MRFQVMDLKIILRSRCGGAEQSPGNALHKSWVLDEALLGNKSTGAESTSDATAAEHVQGNLGMLPRCCCSSLCR